MIVSDRGFRYQRPLPTTAYVYKTRTMSTTNAVAAAPASITWRMNEVPQFVDMIMKNDDCREMMAVFNNVPPTARDQLDVYVATLQELGTRICTLLSDARQPSGTVHIEWNNESDGEAITIGTSVRLSPVARRLLAAFPPSQPRTVHLRTSPLPPIQFRNVPRASIANVPSGANGAHEG